MEGYATCSENSKKRGGGRKSGGLEGKKRRSTIMETERNGDDG